MDNNYLKRCGGVLVFSLITAQACAQMEDVTITTTKVTDSIYMLQGSGGNIGVSVGKDGVILIDDQFAPLTEKIMDAVAQIDKQPIRFVINTHWHFDHTGGNENLGKEGALIVAHENVRERMSKDQTMKAFNREVKAAPEIALPALTYYHRMNFHLNGDDIRILHQPRGHTDGDSILHFTNSNVIHTGDLVFNGFYPFIDTQSGGSIDGVIKAVENILELSDDQTKIIPGHGPLATRADIVAYHAMLTGVREKLLPFIAKKASFSAVEIADPLKEYNEKWGQGFMKPDVFMRIVYTDLAEK